MNPAFTRLTGYAAAEVVGRNCRFLQGDATDRAADHAGSRAALRERVPITEVLLNYRRDGTAFWNQVSISPVFDGEGELVNFVGVQNDVTERVIVEQERRAALAEAEEARGQLRLLAEATTEMTAALDVDGACTRLARIVVPQLADLCAVDLFDRPGEGTARRVAVAARDPADEAQLHRLAQAAPLPPGRRHGDTGRVLAGGEPQLVAGAARRAAPTATPTTRGRRASFDRLRLRSAMVVPLRARGRVLGALTLLHPASLRPPLRPARRAPGRRPRGPGGLAVDNARLYETEHAAAVTLQHSLLPAVPKVDGLQLAARYLVGVDGNQVGGDWYDVLPLPDGAVGVAVGDVVGHDLRAAAAMGQLRGVLRSYAWDGGGPARCSTAATSSCRAWRWRPWPPPSTPASSRPPPTARGCCATPTRGTRPAAAHPAGRAGAPRRAPLADDRCGADPAAARARATPRPRCAARRARCCCSTPTG